MRLLRNTSAHFSVHRSEYSGRSSSSSTSLSKYRIFRISFRHDASTLSWIALILTGPVVLGSILAGPGPVAGAAVLVSDFVLGVDSVEVDEPEAEATPALTPAVGDIDGDGQFDRMTEEDLLRGLEGLVPPAETDDDAE